MAATRSVLRLTSLTVQRVQSRGMAAIKNRKRPSMDEIAIPSEPWAQVNAKRQTRYNTILALGLSALVSTIAFVKISGSIPFYGTPWHLIKKD